MNENNLFPPAPNEASDATDKAGPASGEPDDLTSVRAADAFSKINAFTKIDAFSKSDALSGIDKFSIIDTFSKIDTWVFDLDNTLYPADNALWPKIDARITLFLGHLFGLDGMSARALQKYYYQRYGTTLRGLMQEHDVVAKEYLDFAHDVDRSCLVPNPSLARAIAALPGRKLILTNGTRDHALHTARALGLDEMFEDIFDIVAADFLPKPEAATYERFFDRHAVDPARAIMFEDIARNLVVPHERGMTTALVVPKPGQTDHREAFEIMGEATPPHIDYVTSDLEDFLAAAVRASAFPAKPRGGG